MTSSEEESEREIDRELARIDAVVGKLAQLADMEIPAREEVEREMKRTDVMLANLAQRGVQVQQISVLGVRLMDLVEFLIGDLDAPARRAYETRVQARLQREMREIEKQAGAAQARSVLTSGVPNIRSLGNGR